MLSLHEDVNLNTDSIDVFNDTLINSIKSVASDLGMLKSFVAGKNRAFPNKPWFDTDCREAKLNTHTLLNRMKKDNCSDSSCQEYLAVKHSYHDLYKRKKRDYDERCLNELASSRDSRSFWSFFNKFRFTTKASSTVIFIDTWQVYLSNSFPLIPFPQLPPDIIRVDLLDRDITMEELKRAIAKSKPNKAPGSDLINNNFYKNLPENWLIFILNLFNQIMAHEQTPREWSRLLISPLLKKIIPLILPITDLSHL